MDYNKNSRFLNRHSKRIINTPSPAAKNTFFYLQETGCLKPEDAASSSRHDLDSFLIAAVISGKGELSIDGKHYVLTKGDCFFIDCRSDHEYHPVETEPWEVMWIHFNGAASEQYYEYFRKQSEHVFRPQFFDKIVSAINDMISICEEDPPEAEVLISGGIVDILTIALTSNSSQQQYDTALRQKLAAVHTYIDDHFSEQLSLEKISSQFYISKFYLTREYKKIYGMTIFQHIITARINYGKKLLRFSDRSVDEIAHMCGFNDQSYFARQFKKAENITCFSYRKMWRD